MKRADRSPYMVFLSSQAILPEATPVFLKYSGRAKRRPPEGRPREGRQWGCPRNRRTSLSEVRLPEGSKARRRLVLLRRPSPCQECAP
eukprot:12843359-Alexandrium_andersonii.AAC.1